MLNLIAQRRTIRKYTEEPIAPEMLEKLLEAATQTSNTGNMQVYSAIITTRHDIKAKLAPAHFNQPMVSQAPAVITFCADFNRFCQWCDLRNANHGYNNFESFMAAAIDAMLFAQSFCLAAESEGLGICYLGTTTYNAQEIIEALELPQLVVPVTTVTVGYPNENPPVTDRLPLRSVIHHEKYEDFTSDEINSLYFGKENMSSSKQFVLENSKENLAQVFTDIRYTRKNNEFFSEKFLNALKQQGFLQ